MKQEFEFITVPGNTHGCLGSWVLVVVEDNGIIGTVLNGGSCSSCWQVGHDKDESPIPIGARVRLPDEFPPGDRCWDWQGDTDGHITGKWKTHEPISPSAGFLAWQYASRLSGYSHNELVHDRGYDEQREEWIEPNPDSTLLSPFDLIAL